MPTPISEYLTIVGALLIVAVLLSRASARMGVPALLAFIGLGMLAGEDGFGGIHFSNYRLSFDLSVTALILILFDGGFNTPRSRVRSGLGAGVILATVGVLGTAALIGVIVRLMFPFSWMEALLVGAIIAPTDAATVFSVLGRAGLQLKKGAGITLELESGLNDPMAVLLVAIITRGILESRPIDLPAASFEIVSELVIGAAMGLAVGWLSGKLLSVARPPASAMFPVLTVGIALFSFGATMLAGGSGFVATYVTAIILGNINLPYRAGIRRVHDSLTWLAQLLMFLILGLLITPSAAIRMAIPGLVVGVASMIARFIVVLICLAPLRMELREVAYVGAMGLRGAVPIILAIFPVMAGVPNAQQIFDLVFFAVLVNTVLPGAGAGFLARKLGLGQDRPPAPPAMLEMVSSGVLSGGEFIAFTIEPASAVSGARLSEIPMPPESSILLIIRRNEIIAADGNATLGEGDHVYVFCKPQDSAFVRLIFGLPEPE